MINREIAALCASDQRLTGAFGIAIWGSDYPDRCRDCRSRDLTIRESGHDADWLLVCSNHGRELVVARAEHKPRKAALHWARASVAAYKSELVLWSEGERWIDSVRDNCERDHLSDECLGNHPWDGKGNHLAAPQVLTYATNDLSVGGSVMSVTLICDAGDDVNEIYGSNDLARYGLSFVLDGRYFPVRRTVDLLNSLGRELDGLEPPIEGETRASLIAVFEAMWIRAGKPAELTALAKKWIRPAAENCAFGEGARSELAAGSGCAVVNWTDFLPVGAD